MKVYIDLILVINFIYDFIILLSTSILLKRNASIKRVILSSFIGEVSVITLFNNYTPLYLLTLKVLLSVLMILVTFGKNNFFNNIFYFYIITIVIGGFEYLFSGDKYEVNLVFLLFLSPIVVYLYYRSIKDYNYNLRIKHDVIIIDGINTYKLSGYLDTGNSLVDPITKYPVIMVRDDIKFLTDKYFYVPYKVINDSSILKCIKVDKVIVDNKIVNVLLGLVNTDVFDGTDVILNINLKEII